MKLAIALLTITAARVVDSKASLLVDARSEAAVQGMRGEEADEQPGGAGVSYFRVSGSTTCQGAGGVPVTDMATCRAAAAAVGYTYTVERNFTCEAHGASNADVCTTARPGSCFTHNGELQLFNAPGLCDPPGFGNAGDACLCARDYRGAHNAIDNHLDITEAVRSSCIRGKITNSDGTVRAPLTGGVSCFSAGTDAATCQAKYEVKDRGSHRAPNGSTAYDLLGEVHLCTWQEARRPSVDPATHEVTWTVAGGHCDTGLTLEVCPDDSGDGDYVVEVEPGAGAAGNLGISVCEDGLYLSATSVCTPFTTCTDAEYETVAPVTTTQNRVCATLTVCSPSEYESVAETDTTNRECATKQCTCDNGDPASGAACDTHNTPQCVSCHSGHWLSGSACPAWTECVSTDWIAGNQVAGTEYESTAPTPTSNRVCTPHITCDLTTQYVAVSANGFRQRTCADLTVCIAGSQYETVSETATTNRQCQPITSCNSDEYQTAAPTGTSDRACTPLTVCSPSEYESVAETDTTNRQCSTCSTCPSSQYAQATCAATTNTVCATKVCNCANGVGQTGSACNTHNTEQCASCSSGFVLDGTQCVDGDSTATWASRPGNCRAIVLYSNPPAAQYSFATANACIAACATDDKCEACWGPWSGNPSAGWQMRQSCHCTGPTSAIGLTSPPSWCADVECGTLGTGATDSCNTAQGGTTYFKPVQPQLYDYVTCNNALSTRPCGDVPSSIGGVVQCRNCCNSQGYALFGFECPHNSNSANEEVHCECGNSGGSDDGQDGFSTSTVCNGGNGNNGAGHCAGPYVVSGSIGSYALGTAHANSVYRTAAR